MGALLIINEKHNLMEDQKRILEKNYENWEIINSPNEGWSKKEIEEQKNNIISKYALHDVIFVSPIPYLIKLLTADQYYQKGIDEAGKIAYKTVTVKIFHNDKREKKELSNGKIINTVAKEGWELV